MSTMTRTIAYTLSEKAFQDMVVQAARYLGWKVYHPWTSIRSVAGYPDLTLVREPRVLFIELKTARGKLSPDQEEWAARLSACPGVEYRLFRPADWDAAMEVLR